jgi:hypothetical protein
MGRFKVNSDNNLVTVTCVIGHLMAAADDNRLSGATRHPATRTLRATAAHHRQRRTHAEGSSAPPQHR